MLDKMTALEMFALLPKLDSLGGVRQHHLQIVLIDDQPKIAYDFSGLGTTGADKSLKALSLSLSKMPETQSHVLPQTVVLTPAMVVYQPSEDELDLLDAQAAAKLEKAKVVTARAGKTIVTDSPTYCALPTEAEEDRLARLVVTVAKAAGVDSAIVLVGMDAQCQTLLTVDGPRKERADNLAKVTQAVETLVSAKTIPPIEVVPDREDLHSHRPLRAAVLNAA